MANGSLGWAAVIACPSCAATFVFSIGAIFGVTALAMKGALLVAGVTLLATLWVRNILKRRGESCSIPTRLDASA